MGEPSDLLDLWRDFEKKSRTVKRSLRDVFVFRSVGPALDDRPNKYKNFEIRDFLHLQNCVFIIVEEAEDDVFNGPNVLGKKLKIKIIYGYLFIVDVFKLLGHFWTKVMFLYFFSFV